MLFHKQKVYDLLYKVYRCKSLMWDCDRECFDSYVTVQAKDKLVSINLLVEPKIAN